MVGESKEYSAYFENYFDAFVFAKKEIVDSLFLKTLMTNSFVFGKDKNKISVLEFSGISMFWIFSSTTKYTFAMK